MNREFGKNGDSTEQIFGITTNCDSTNFHSTNKLKKFGIFGKNFPNPNQRRLTQPGPKIFDPEPSVVVQIALF